MKYYSLERFELFVLNALDRTESFVSIEDMQQELNCKFD